MVTDLHLVMHGVAIKKHGNVDAIASVIGLPPKTVDAVLASALKRGRVAGADGKYMLTPAGQMILGSEYSRFYEALRSDADFVASYERFEHINKELKQVITDWQTVEIGGKRVPNDHSDQAYDDKIIGRLGSLHERFEPLLDRMAAREPRFGVYKRKLVDALDKVEDGDIAWVSDARIESYHTVWFELHEDLLRLLGRRRDE